MEKNLTSRTITGGIILILGFVLIVVAFFGGWPALIYGIPLIILGLYILMNGNEDKIEKRKDLKGGSKKKK